MSHGADYVPVGPMKRSLPTTAALFAMHAVLACAPKPGSDSEAPSAQPVDVYPVTGVLGQNPASFPREVALLSAVSQPETFELVEQQPPFPDTPQGGMAVADSERCDVAPESLTLLSEQRAELVKRPSCRLMGWFEFGAEQGDWWEASPLASRALGDPKIGLVVSGVHLDWRLAKGTGGTSAPAGYTDGESPCLGAIAETRNDLGLHDTPLVVDCYEDGWARVFYREADLEHFVVMKDGERRTEGTFAVGGSWHLVLIRGEAAQVVLPGPGPGRVVPEPL